MNPNKTKFVGHYVAIMLVFCTLIAVGCRHTGPSGEYTSQLSIPDAYSQTGGERAVTSSWWTVFGDTALNENMQIALQNNFDVIAAWERLRSAQALARSQRADGRVQLDARARAGVEDDSETGSTQNYLAGFQASYEVDLWGSIRSQTEAERMRAEASAQAYQTALLSLSAEMTRTWFRLGEALAQAALVKQQIETNEKVLSLQKARFASGLIRSADVLRQRQLLESTREQAVVVESRVRTLQNLFCVLQGVPPQQGRDMSHAKLPDLPVLPDVGVPAELVERRPDVQQAYYILKAADRDLATAMSRRYPRIYLTASLESAAEDASDLFTDWLSSIVGELVAPIFTGGRIKANITRAEADRNERIARYQQAVLTAFREVEDALVQEQQQKKRVASIEKQMMLAKDTYQQLRDQYANGVTDYIAVLSALADQQESERDLLSARLTLLEYRIGLYRAIAGSVEIPENEPKQSPEGDAEDV